MNANLSQRSACIGVELESRAEEVALVRSVLATLAEVASVDEALLADLKTAVSEACNNVVQHAYAGAPGPMLVTIEVRPGSIDVNVRDHGRGIQQLTGGGDRTGLGMAVMTALAAEVQFISPADGGAEVRMSFARRQGPGEERGAEDGAQPGAHELSVPPADELPYDPIETLGGRVVVHVSPAVLVGPVLGRLARAVAAHSGFSVARFEDLYPVADAVADHARRAADGSLSFAVRASRRSIELVAGPFNPLADGTERFGGLVDDVSVEPIADHDLLHLTLLDRAG